MLEWRLGERQDPTGLMWNYDEYLRVYLDRFQPSTWPTDGL